MPDNEKKRLLDKIRRYAFALDESRLFLDSHPDCEEAVDFFKKHLKLYEDAVEEYQEKFVPVSASGAVRKGKWAWNTTPWPWERSEN